MKTATTLPLRSKDEPPNAQLIEQCTATESSQFWQGFALSTPSPTSISAA